MFFQRLQNILTPKAFDISPSEIKQIAGRAGRYLKFPVGTVTCLARVDEGLSKISNALREGPSSRKNNVWSGFDLDIFNQVNTAFVKIDYRNSLFQRFLRLFNTMIFKKPFFCVDLKEMIELTEMVEEADDEGNLTSAETFGFSCAPVNLGACIDHVQYFIYILNKYVRAALFSMSQLKKAPLISIILKQRLNVWNCFSGYHVTLTTRTSLMILMLS